MAYRLTLLYLSLRFFAPALPVSTADLPAERQAVPSGLCVGRARSALRGGLRGGRAVARLRMGQFPPDSVLRQVGLPLG